jgi:ADP-ribosylation factor related protein 1
LARREELHILIIGLDKSGKTTLLERLKTLYTDFPGLEPTQILPTVGLNIGRLEAVDTPLVLWDLGGQVGLRSIWDKYYAESHAVVFVLDAADGRRVDEAKAVLDRAIGALLAAELPSLAEMW